MLLEVGVEHIADCDRELLDFVIFGDEGWTNLQRVVRQRATDKTAFNEFICDNVAGEVRDNLDSAEEAADAALRHELVISKTVELCAQHRFEMSGTIKEVLVTHDFNVAQGNRTGEGMA